MVGNSATSDWLSVCPPLSASTVMSSATGNFAASVASDCVSEPCSTSARSIASGGGDMKRCATSAREIFANTWCLRTTRPDASTVTPEAAHRTTAGVRPMNADTEMRVTPLRRSRSATRSSRAGSFGE